MKRRQQLLALFLLLLSLPLSAQSVRDSVTIEVVDVPVFVSRNGAPVEGLIGDDFELYVNGKPQPIEYFDVIGTQAGVPADSLRERRLFLLVFDVAFTPPFALGRSQKAAAELIARAPTDDLFAIATYSSRKGIWFATPFTSDRIALARGISNLSSSESGDPLGLVMTASERASMNDWASMTPDRSEWLLSDAMLDRFAGAAMRDIYQMELRRSAENQILDLRDLAGRLAALQGQKHVVLLSEGFDGSRNGSIAATRRTFTIADVSGTPGSPFQSPGIDYASLFRPLQEMTHAFQSADILLHALDLKGVVSLNGSDALSIMSASTNGQFMHNRNDLGNALVDLTENVRTGYVLGFKPVGAKSKHNSIEVKVKNQPRGTTVKHRKGFTGTPRAFDVNEGLYLADVVLNDVPQTGTAAELKLDGDTLNVRVPLRPLAAQLGKSGKAELMLYLFGEDGVPLGFHRHDIDVAADASGEKAFIVKLPEGARVAKALLRVDDSLGFSRTGP